MILNFIAVHAVASYPGGLGVRGYSMQLNMDGLMHKYYLVQIGGG